ncbi:MAG: RecX family transcriptional regulator [Hespellia sp.]|nr:RecX family transcriptional regulator [Hespellia sp.]
MVVTKIEPANKTRYKVYLDGQFAFALYKGELSRYKIREEQELDESLFQKIKNEIVVKRAKLRAMHLLNDMDRTESELRMKLKQGLCTEDVIDIAMDYVKSFGYIDDYRYAIHFIDIKRQSKSKKEIYAALVQKGVSAELIETAMEESYGPEGEREAIRRLLTKKRYDIANADQTQMQKIYAFLARKGFRYEDIRQVVQYYNENT